MIRTIPATGLRSAFVLAAFAALSACAQPQATVIPSKKSALELRSIQTREVDMPADAALRGAIATLHDLGYRITRVAPDARTVSATRAATLRMAVAVQPRDEARSAVRANAFVIAPLTETQVDSAAFYQQNFFAPFAAQTGRMIADLPSDATAPDAVRPVAEINTAREREARAVQTSQSSSASSTGASAP